MIKQEGGTPPPNMDNGKKKNGNGNGNGKDQLAAKREEAQLKRMNERIEKRFEEKLANIHSREGLTTSEKNRMMESLGRQMVSASEMFEEIKEEMLRVQSEHENDPVSGLIRQPALIEFYELALKGLLGDEQMVVVAFDLDKFKTINDAIGHVEADKLLRKIGDILNENLRPDDRACRIGGDEFVFFLNHMHTFGDKQKEIDEVLNVLTRLVEILDKEAIWTDTSGAEHHITLSAGCSFVRNDQKPYFERPREQADQAALGSKGAGRNHLTFKQAKDQYVTFRFNPERTATTDKTPGYQLDKVINIQEALRSRRACESELEGSTQRVVEEIENFMRNANNEDKTALENLTGIETLSEIPLKKLKEIVKDFQNTDWKKLTFEAIVDLLYIVRTAKG